VPRNNAALSRGSSRDIWNVNLPGPLFLTRALEPLLERNARVVMVTSGLGDLGGHSASLVKRLSDPNCDRLLRVISRWRFVPRRGERSRHCIGKTARD
jgi:NAD(P)-dependent dehydrogenase (short-subunit alcohol dehydrogenase family)